MSYISEIDGQMAIHGIKIPGKLSDICSPTYEEMLRFYPEFIKQSGFNWSIQAYFCALQKGLAELVSDKSAQQIFDQFISYMGGLSVVCELFDDLKKQVDLCPVDLNKS